MTERAAPDPLSRVAATVSAALKPVIDATAVLARTIPRLDSLLSVTDTSATGAPGAPDTHQHPHTLAIDIGGTGLKANVLDAAGTTISDRVRTPTTYPMPPDLMVEKLTGLAKRLPAADRISAGFPGMVRRGRVLSAPHFVTRHGPGTEVDPELTKEWSGFDLAGALSQAIGKPCRVANDADVQGAAVVKGDGYEVVVTLGTGFGTAFFMDGRLLPHMEFAHVDFRKEKSFNEELGEPVRKKLGDKKWNKRVRDAIAYLDMLTQFDHLYIGGGNAGRIDRRDLGEVLERITVVDNSAGILGGIKLWDDNHVGLRSDSE
jgi:polyphosphate glucokinase